MSRGREEGLEVVNEEDDSPLVYPEMVRTLKGEVDEEGNEKEDFDREEVLRSAQELLDQGARCLVVCLGNSVYNPAHERRARSWIKEEYPRDHLGSVLVFLASDVIQLPGDQERINTAVVNAYINARLVKFLYKAGEDLRKRFYSRPLLIVHATGGVARVSKTRAINTYNSGPCLLRPRGDEHDGDRRRHRPRVSNHRILLPAMRLDGREPISPARPSDYP